MESIRNLKRLGIRQMLLQALNFATVISTALMMWKGLSLVTNSESPIVVVLSGSMEPAFYRGDLLFLALPPSQPLSLGDITVYNAPAQKIPIVHRVIETHDAPLPKKGKKQLSSLIPTSPSTSTTSPDYQLILTKGDNNREDDVAFYSGATHLNSSQVVGKVYGYIPYVGYVTIAMTDYPILKYCLLGFLGIGMLLQRE